MTVALLAVWLGVPLPPDLAAAVALRQALAELRAARPAGETGRAAHPPRRACDGSPRCPIPNGPIDWLLPATP